MSYYDSIFSSSDSSESSNDSSSYSSRSKAKKTQKSDDYDYGTPFPEFFDYLFLGEL